MNIFNGIFDVIHGIGLILRYVITALIKASLS